MASQITIEDLRYIISQQYKPKSGTSSSQLNSYLNAANSLWNTSSQDYAGWFYDFSAYAADESSRTSGVPRRRALSIDELAYYDPTAKYTYT
jgi:hypothetical protein